MAKIKCPACGKANMEIKTIPQLETEFEGVAIAVQNARVSECPACGERTYSAKELRRWKEIKQATLAEAGVLLNGEDVKKVREQLGLGVERACERQGFADSLVRFVAVVRNRQ